MEDFARRYSEVYTHLSRNRVIFLSEDVTKEMASTLCSLLVYYNSINPTEEIHIFINTLGGDALALSGIYDVMTNIEAPVSTIGIGKIYSAGSFILAAGTKGKRFMFKNAEVMLHGLQCTYPELPLSDQKDSIIYYNYLDNLNKRMLKIMSKHTGQTIEKITEDSKRDLFLDAKNALKYGIIDKIL